MTAIQVTNLVKRFGDLTALQGISFSVAKGETFGFL
ncbi:MAG: ABC transporter ATP-binding protein, partial [Methanospirillum sp.]|nr:ABC transporter ATP-binding protein [Methanospirillum sp.]